MDPDGQAQEENRKFRFDELIFNQFVKSEFCAFNQRRSGVEKRHKIVLTGRVVCGKLQATEYFDHDRGASHHQYRRREAFAMAVADGKGVVAEGD